MSMNPEQENFKDLRRLLVLKRYEQPPPGYFAHFSRQLTARLEAGERFERPSVIETLFWQAPWFQRLWNVLESKPVIAGAFAAVVCGFLLASVGYSERVDSPSAIALVPPTSEAVPSARAEGSPNLAGVPAPVFSSTAGVSVMQTRDSLLQEIKGGHPLAQSIVFPHGN